MKKIVRLVFLMCVAAFVQATPAAEPATTTSASAPTVSEYRLGPGDGIRITVFQNPDLTVETRVSESGNVTYPLIGAVRIGGLTIPEAEKAISTRLREGGFVQKPQVSILVLQVRGSQVSVLGMVAKPGRYPIETLNMRVSEALALAGGAAAPNSAGADTAILTGVRDGRPYRVEIDIPSIFMGDKHAQDIPVMAGDVIYVHRAPVYYIYGEVQRPGAYRLERNMTVLQGLALGGGLTPRGTERGLRIHRTGIDGKVEVLTPEKDQLIKENDVLYVKESFF